MTVAKEHAARHVNVLSVGVIEGSSQPGAVQANNWQILQHWADQGYSLYFPPGEYEVSSPISFSSADNVKVWGDNAVLQQMNDNNRLLVFSDCNSIEVSGLHLRSPYFTRRTVISESRTETLVYSDRCSEINVHNNVIEGFACYAVSIGGGVGIKISDNVFKDGHFQLAGNFENSADIHLTRIDGIGCREITITGNHCNTQSLIGIFSSLPTRNLVCTNNVVISKDELGNEDNSCHPEQRKAGIELQYHTDTSLGNDDQDTSQYTMTIDNNIVSGFRYGGISCQSSSLANNNTGGIRGSISNNVIRYGATEQTAASDRVQGGILINQYRDLTITGNIIKDIENDVANTWGTSAIHVQNTNQLSATTGGTLSSCVIEGNVITDCRSMGIVNYLAGDMIVSNNILRDVAARNLRIFNNGATPRGGRVIIAGNKFVSALQVSESQLRVEGSDADYLIDGNHLDFSGTFAGAFSLMQLFNTRYSCTNNRFVGGGGTSVGLDVATSSTGRMYQIISENSFENLGTGIFSNAASTRGPSVYTNCNFVNCTTEVASPTHMYAGYFTQDNRVAVYATAVPTQGNWLSGDIVWNSNMTSGNPMGWICTTPGAPGTFVFTPLANMP